MNIVVNAIQTVSGYIANVGVKTIVGLGGVGSSIVEGTKSVLSALFLGQ